MSLSIFSEVSSGNSLLKASKGVSPSSISPKIIDSCHAFFHGLLWFSNTKSMFQAVSSTTNHIPETFFIVLSIIILLSIRFYILEI